MLCNREMRRVYTAYDPRSIDHILSFHNGNKGFGHKLGALLIITADCVSYTKSANGIRLGLVAVSLRCRLFTYLMRLGWELHVELVS